MRAWRGRLCLTAAGREPASTSLNLTGSFGLMQQQVRSSQDGLASCLSMPSGIWTLSTVLQQKRARGKDLKSVLSKLQCSGRKSLEHRLALAFGAFYSFEEKSTMLMFWYPALFTLMSG